MSIPKGIRVRSTPDWFTQFLSTGGAYIDSVPNQYIYVSLYNDSKRGAFLFVYAVYPIAGDSIIAPAFLIQGTIGSQTGVGSRVNPSIGAPPGQIYLAQNGASAIVATLTSVMGIAFASGALSLAPLFIIPPGQSLVMGGQGADGEYGCGFWYIPFLDSQGRNPA